MSDHDKKPKSGKLTDKLDGLNIDGAEKAFRGAAKKGLSFFKTAKDALKGDEAAKEKLTEAASTAMINAQEKAEKAAETLGELAEKVEKKIEQKRGKNPTP